MHVFGLVNADQCSTQSKYTSPKIQNVPRLLWRRMGAKVIIKGSAGSKLDHHIVSVAMLESSIYINDVGISAVLCSQHGESSHLIVEIILRVAVIGFHRLEGVDMGLRLRPVLQNISNAVSIID